MDLVTCPGPFVFVPLASQAAQQVPLTPQVEFRLLLDALKAPLCDYYAVVATAHLQSGRLLAFALFQTRLADAPVLYLQFLQFHGSREAERGKGNSLFDLPCLNAVVIRD